MHWFFIVFLAQPAFATKIKQYPSSLWHLSVPLLETSERTHPQWDDIRTVGEKVFYILRLPSEGRGAEVEFEFVKVPRKKMSQSFYMMSTWVTQKHWQAVMGENPSVSREHDMWEELPVENVSAYPDVDLFVSRLNEEMTRRGLKGHLRLPKDKEWSRAARQNLSSDFRQHRSVYIAAQQESPSPVKDKASGNLGAVMFGNVWEWTASEAVKGMRIVRGGGAKDRITESGPDAQRAQWESFRSAFTGFRLVRISVGS